MLYYRTYREYRLCIAQRDNIPYIYIIQATFALSYKYIYIKRERERGDGDRQSACKLYVMRTSKLDSAGFSSIESRRQLARADEPRKAGVMRVFAA